jgi:hypothetical protein
MIPHHFYSRRFILDSNVNCFPLSKRGAGPRGFTLLIAIILSSVALSLALALLDISYKQILLALASKQSQYAFANADSALECALYWDFKQDLFNYNTATGNAVCNGNTIAVSYNQSTTPRQRTFTVPCTAGGTTVSATITILKSSDATTVIYSDGYSTCNVSDARRIERGIRATY